MRDDRIRQLATVDKIAKTCYTNRILFVFKSDNATAVYIFGRRVYASRIWNAYHQWQPSKGRRWEQ